ncbi:glycosyltransferase family 4 protein [Sinomonas halotolerans]|uniref:Glycosyltransferase family 4 protein n=1 Tax=Sinomonas halotolerans TaxID=1644133 RepID=A0ABU9X296_9MICC
MPAVRFVVPEGLGYSSGGNVYNARLAHALEALGVRVEMVPVPGAWPVGSPEDRARLAEALAPAGLEGSALEGAGHDGVAAVLVDGLLACGAPEALRAASSGQDRAVSGRDRPSPAGPASASARLAAHGRPRLGVLVHMSLPDAPGLSPHDADRLAALERDALAQADAVVVPSAFAAARLAARYGTQPHVARPGVVHVPPAPGSLAAGRAPHLLCVGALTPGKGQLALVRALGELRGLAWTAQLAGHDADPSYAALVRQEVGRLGLADRISVPGELTGRALEDAWERADLMVLASVSETFGMAVTEALARGVPAVVGAGTGAEEALALPLAGPAPEGPDGPDGPGQDDPEHEGPGLAGTACEPTTEGLVPVLGRWLTDEALRGRWRAAALAGRPRLPGWDTTARAVGRALGLTLGLGSEGT